MPAFVPFAISAIQPEYTPRGPTRPHVPMPLAIAGPFILRWNTQVAIGPVTADARVGAIQILGFLTMLPI